MDIKIDIVKEIPKYKNELNLDFIKEYVRSIIKSEYNKDCYISILLTDNKKVQYINNIYRNKNEETDVISFAYLETDYSMGNYISLGDIAISLEKIEEQSKKYKNTYKREFYYILTHGILHLLGYDHINKKDRKLMRKKEEELLALYL